MFESLGWGQSSQFGRERGGLALLAFQRERHVRRRSCRHGHIPTRRQSSVLAGSYAKLWGRSHGRNNWGQPRVDNCLVSPLESCSVNPSHHKLVQQKAAGTTQLVSSSRQRNQVDIFNLDQSTAAVSPTVRAPSSLFTFGTWGKSQLSQHPRRPRQPIHVPPRVRLELTKPDFLPPPQPPKCFERRVYIHFHCNFACN